MADPAFPDVPPFPGVPPLSRPPGTAGLPVLSRMTADSPSVRSTFASGQKPRWGVYKNDGVTPVLVGDSVLSVEYEREFHIPTYPVEDGGFQSYNKVATPREMSVKLSQGGTKFDRERFITLAAVLVAETALYAIVQPERFYSDMNFVRMRYNREGATGPQLLIVELFAEEVRLSASTKFSNTQNPDDADAANQGTVQTQDPGPTQVSALSPPT